MSWFSPNTVSRYYYAEHIIFVLRNLVMILLGVWPTRPKPDGTDDEAYTASPGEFPSGAGSYGVAVKDNTIAFSLSASETAINIAFEVEKRIDMTGRDGRFARAIYTQGISYWKLAKWESKNKWGYIPNVERANKAIEIQDRVERAVEWASGKKRKTKPYKEG